MITGFLKKHRAAIIITGSYILLMLFFICSFPGLLRSGEKPRQRMNAWRCCRTPG